MQQLQKKAKFRGVIFDNGPVLPKYIQQPTGKVEKVLKLQRYFKRWTGQLINNTVEHELVGNSFQVPR